MSRRINFFDGAQSATVPTIGNVVASDILVYANDAAYEAANTGAPVEGNLYYNSTLDLIRYYKGGSWISLADVSSTQTFTNKTISGTSNTLTNLDANNVILDSIANLTATNAQSAFAEHQDDIDDLTVLSGVAANSTHLGTFTGTTIPDSNTVKQALQSLETEVETKEDLANKGVAGGYASLDGGGKVPLAQLPSALMTYEGVWNASTNSPSLADGVGDIGMVYRVSVAGSQNLGSGSISFDVGDYVILNSSLVWEKSDTTDAVASVNSLTGVVVFDTDHISEGANLYFTDERAQDAVGNILTDSSTVDFTYNDAGPSISAIVIDDSITNSKLANVSTQTIKGRTTAGTGDPEDLTATQATAILNNFVGDSGSGGTKGLVPAPAAGDTAALKFLKADGTWAVPAGASGTFADNVFTIQDNIDNTKQMQFQLSGITTGNTRTLTVPDASATLVGTDNIQTLSNKDVRVTYTTKSANYTLVSTDELILSDSSGGSFTLTLPAAASNAGKVFKFKKTSSDFNPITIDANASETIDGQTVTTIDTQYEYLEIVCDGSNWHIVDRKIDETWYDFTPTGVLTTNAIYQGKRRRQGDSWQFMVEIAFSGANTQGLANINIPNSMTIDTTKLNETAAGVDSLGQGVLFDASTERLLGVIKYLTTTSVGLAVQDEASGSQHYVVNVDTSINNPITIANGDKAQYYFSVPISGWKGN